MRLNYKPYPIKENTFEMWNSYVDKEMINKIKDIYSKHKNWFFLRKNNTRMDNEGLYTFLIYLEFKIMNMEVNKNSISDFLDIYKSGNKINLRAKSKDDITRTLESLQYKDQMLESCNKLENLFINKLKNLIDDGSNDKKILSVNLEKMLNIDNSRRTQQSIYALWFILSNISLDLIKYYKKDLVIDINKLFKLMGNISSIDDFENSIETFWNKYNKIKE